MPSFRPQPPCTCHRQPSGNFTPLPCESCGGGPGGPGGDQSPGPGTGCENGSASVIELCDILPDDCRKFLRHVAYDCDGQPISTVDTTLDGITPYTPQGEVGDCDDCPCPPCSKRLILCDCHDDGTSTQFIRRLEYDCETGQVTSQEDTELDGTTPYTPTGTVGDCDDCPCPPCSKRLILCDCHEDGTSTQFIRRLEYDCETGQVTSQEDTELDGTTPYTPTGTVGECPCGSDDEPSPGPEPCESTPMCPGFVGLSGPETWTIPPRTESVHLSVVCGPVTVYPCSGATDGVIVNECGTSLQWSAPGTCCHPGELCPDFWIELPEGAAAYVTYLTTECGDDDS